jgi:hypothetical protein
MRNLYMEDANQYDLYQGYQDDMLKISAFIGTGWKACATRFPGVD